MLKETVTQINGLRVVLMDSISSIGPDDEGQIVVSASHGGVSSGQFATSRRLGACFFNDAGVGKEDAGIAALGMLEDLEVAGATLSHESARIGDARDHWEHGIVSHVNAAAARAGLRPGLPVQASVAQLAG